MRPTTLPLPWQPPALSADFKRMPEDFIVTEMLDIEHSGSGEHLWLHITKINLNTAYVAKLLAAWAGVPARDVGYSGSKIGTRSRISGLAFACPVRPCRIFLWKISPKHI